MLAGIPAPWGQQSLVSTALQLFHGRLLFMAQSDLARCLEEQKLLPLEVARVRVWCTFMLSTANDVTDSLLDTPMPAVFGVDTLPSIAEAFTVHAMADSSSGTFLPASACCDAGVHAKRDCCLVRHTALIVNNEVAGYWPVLL